MKNVLLVVLIVSLNYTANAQKFSAEKGMITFFSDAPLEDIKADNHMVGSLFNATSGEVVYIVKIKDFRFDKSLMREHFNEKYMETEKYPKSTFTGKIVGFKLNVAGEQKVKAVGKLHIHGVTRDVEIPGNMSFVNGKVTMKSKFILRLADYKIQIPKIVFQNIAEEIEVTIDFTYKPV